MYKNKILQTKYSPPKNKSFLKEPSYHRLIALLPLKQVETFRRWTGNLDLIVNMNNDVLNKLLPVEKPLVLPYLTKVSLPLFLALGVALALAAAVACICPIIVLSLCYHCAIIVLLIRYYLSAYSVLMAY